MLALALLPTASRALLGPAGGGGTPVCTPQGLKWQVLASAPDRDGEGPAMPVVDPCALCLLASDLATLPTPTRPGLLPPAGSAAPPAPRRSPLRHEVWRAAQPRAPPQFS